MNHAPASVLIVSFFALCCVSVESTWAQDGQRTATHRSGKDEVSPADAARIQGHAPTTIVEARGRARLLHETLHGALQVMHRDFFREDEGLKIPSRSLEDVFRELARSHAIKLRWIAVDANAMDVDHEAKTKFEKDAVRSLKSGKEEFESVTDDEYRFAGRIRLSATCLACHASRRSSNDDRSAGLVIIMPTKIVRDEPAAPDASQKVEELSEKTSS